MEIDRTRLRDEAYRYEVITALVRDYQDHVFRYCVTRLGEVQGEEIAQEVFLTAWETLPKFRQEASIETWLVGIAKYKCLQTLRNRTRRRAISRGCVADIRQRAHAEAPEAPEHVVVTRTRFDQLAQGLARLRDDERILLNLRYLRGLSVAEIVEVVGKSEAAVRKRLLRALHHLREVMDDASAA